MVFRSICGKLTENTTKIVWPLHKFNFYPQIRKQNKTKQTLWVTWRFSSLSCICAMLSFLNTNQSQGGTKGKHVSYGNFGETFYKQSSFIKTSLHIKMTSEYFRENTAAAYSPNAMIYRGQSVLLTSVGVSSRVEWIWPSTWKVPESWKIRWLDHEVCSNLDSVISNLDTNMSQGNLQVESAGTSQWNKRPGLGGGGRNLGCPSCLTLCLYHFLAITWYHWRGTAPGSTLVFSSITRLGEQSQLLKSPWGFWEWL